MSTQTMSSIRTKLITNTMLTIALIFVGVLSVMILKDLLAANQSMKTAEQQIREAILTRGHTLVTNNSIALSQMVAENAFSAIQAIVGETVKSDPDLVYGIFMDTQSVPWAVATHDNASGVPPTRNELKDDVAAWAASLTTASNQLYAHKEYGEIFEFASPVRAENEILGVIRYGISTRAMHAALQDAKAVGIRARNTTVTILLLLGGVSLGASFIFVRKLATTITQPMTVLANAAKTIAQGNFQQAIVLPDTAEIRTLAAAFAEMRDTIKLVISEIERLILAVKQGQLDQRSHADTFTGGWRDILLGINQILDAMIAPIHVTAAYIQELSADKIPATITEDYQGDFNTIKTNFEFIRR